MRLIIFRRSMLIILFIIISLAIGPYLSVIDKINGKRIMWVFYYTYVLLFFRFLSDFIATLFVKTVSKMFAVCDRPSQPTVPKHDLQHKCFNMS